MAIDFLMKVFDEHREDAALVWRDEQISYGMLGERVDACRERLATTGIEAGDVVAVEAEFSPNAVALFLALAERGAIIVPLSTRVANRDALLGLAEVEVTLRVDGADDIAVEPTTCAATHEHYETLRAASRPGLVLFSSGSTGTPKAMVHDLTLILEKFQVKKRAFRTVPFLLFDHIGGVNTMLYTLSSAGCLVTVADRSPDGVLAAVQGHGVELLPTSPTFLNLVLLSEAWRRWDLSSLRLVTYGTEPMPESTLRRFRAALPALELRQTYGLSELGILRSRSEAADSLWVKLGGEGFSTRVVDSKLQIKARSAMLGYLNAPAPFTEDGWFETGDVVEERDGWMRILGRESELINVGGEKVYPAEVESVVQEVEAVAEVTVFGERNPIMGQVVAARITLAPGMSSDDATREIRQHCAARLDRFKIPVRLVFTQDAQHGVRFKKDRAVHA